RQEKIKEEVRARLSPIEVTSITDDDVLEFDPEALKGDWWIDGILPRGETVILFGSPTSGKSFAAIDLAMGVASGSEAWGKSVKQGRVLYLAGEGTRRLSLRRKAWEVFHQSEPDAVQYRKMRLLLGSDKSVAQHRDLVTRTGADIIVVDSLLRASVG